ncbi:MAG: VanZ family protein [Rhodoglobus sp.]
MPAPFGFYLGLLAPAWRWWRPFLIFVGASLVLEVVQYLISVGIADVTDVITNTLGGLAGFGLLRLMRRRVTTRTLVTICVVFTALSVIAAAAFIASPIRLAGPHDVIFPSPTARP